MRMTGSGPSPGLGQAGGGWSGKQAQPGDRTAAAGAAWSPRAVRGPRPGAPGPLCSSSVPISHSRVTGLGGAGGGGIRRPWPGRSEGSAWHFCVHGVLGHLLSSAPGAPLCLGPSGPEPVNKKDTV